MNKKSGLGIHVGFSSVLVTFVLICLITFATLSLVTVSSGKKLTDKSIKHISDYYKAYSESEYIIGSIYDTLENESNASSSSAEFLSGIDTRLSEAVSSTASSENIDVTDLKIQTNSEHVLISYNIPYDNNALSVIIEGSYDKEFMRILSYKTISVSNENDYQEKKFDIMF